MIRKAVALGVGVTMILSCGCLVQSLKPFCPEDADIAVPEIVGEWELVKYYGDDVDATKGKIKPWHFYESSIEALDQSNVCSELEVKYFKVGDGLYVDAAPGELPEGLIGTEYQFHLAAVHSLWRVLLSEERLVLTPLNMEWVTEQAREKKLDLPYVQPDDDEEDHLLFSASAEQWVAVLKTLGKSSDLFDEEHVMVFQKVKKAKPEPAAETPK